MLTFGGTVYDGAGAPVVDAEVRLVDATGHAISVYTGTSGNFYSLAAWTAPASVGVRNATSVALQLSTISSGDCNGCHQSADAGGTQPPIHLP